mmetsp:Transcript_65943/g.176727  ORF Transcript_65943/g.176727 Transcript_65943/m.176727 type:complete len:222 (+) Transcript_65943:364-1029(+)
MTAWWTARSISPPCLGSSEGCTLRRRPAQSRQNWSETMRMKPMSSTRSTFLARSALVTSRSKSSRTLPLPGMWTQGMPCTLARSRMGADSMLLTTTSTRAFSIPSWMALRMGCSDDPRVDPTTPRRTRRSSVWRATLAATLGGVAMSARWKKSPLTLRTSPSHSRSAISRVGPTPMTATVRDPVESSWGSGPGTRLTEARNTLDDLACSTSTVWPTSGLSG